MHVEDRHAAWRDDDQLIEDAELLTWIQDAAPVVNAYLRRFTDRSERGDFVASALCHVWTNRAEMRTRDGVRAALIESLRESCRRHVADRRRFVRLNDVHVAVVAPSSPSPNVSVDERACEQAWFAGALRELSPNQRICVTQHIMGGRDYATVAAILGCSVGTARVHCLRALLRLRAYATQCPPPATLADGSTAAVKSPQRDSVSDWPEAMKLSRFAGGNPHAPVTIIAAIDFECPACAAFHQTLQEVLAARRNDVQVRYMHWPLPYHRFALPAARAAECAAADGKFPAWADLMYKKRDSLGIESWGRFAAEAGIVDTARIARCATSPDPVAAIQAGTAFAKRAGGQGTPTVIISGWRFSSPPTRATLDSLLDAAVRSSHARS